MLHTVLLENYLFKVLICLVYVLQEQSKSNAENLIANITNLISNHSCQQKEMVYIDKIFIYLFIPFIKKTPFVRYSLNFTVFADRCMPSLLV